MIKLTQEFTSKLYENVFECRFGNVMGGEQMTIFSSLRIKKHYQNCTL